MYLVQFSMHIFCSYRTVLWKLPPKFRHILHIIVIFRSIDLLEWRLKLLTAISFFSTLVNSSLGPRLTVILYRLRYDSNQHFWKIHTCPDIIGKCVKQCTWSLWSHFEITELWMNYINNACVLNNFDNANRITSMYGFLILELSLK